MIGGWEGVQCTTSGPLRWHKRVLFLPCRMYRMGTAIRELYYLLYYREMIENVGDEGFGN